MYKLIALDMDGTLLNEDKEISARSHEAIRNLKSIGKKVVLATGRPLNGVIRYIHELDLFDDDDYVVTFNGALVQSTKNNVVILDYPLSLNAYEELYTLSLLFDVNIHALTDSSVLTPKNNPYTEIESRINEIPTVVIPVKNIDAYTLIIKVMFVDDPEKLDMVVKALPNWVKEKYTIVRSAPYFLEFLNPNVNKGVGVDAIAKKLGMTHKDIICVGDAGNDVAMIEYAHLGVAMGNASDDVKQIANYITHTNEEDGVAHVIEQFMLNKKIS